MIIGVPKEIKNHEYRVAMLPEGVKALTDRGHTVLVEHNCAAAIGYEDEHYQQAGAQICPTAAEVFARATLIVKVKEPQPEEYALLKPEHILFTYLHLAPNQELTQQLLTIGCAAIAYETVSDKNGYLPLLAPMSEVAGKLATQVGSHYLQTSQGGRGVLMGGITGVDAAKVLVLGGGVVGSNAVKVAVGLGAKVCLVDRYDAVLEKQKALYPDLQIINSAKQSIAGAVAEADLLIGAVLVAGASAPKVVSKAMVSSMKKGSVIVDVAIDQGGCIETSQVTSHDEPIFKQFGVIHYCVGNMPSSAAWTATKALSDATLPYILQIAEQGLEEALKENSNLLRGLNVYQHQLYCEAVARAQGLAWQAFA